MINYLKRFEFHDYDYISIYNYMENEIEKYQKILNIIK